MDMLLTCPEESKGFVETCEERCRKGCARKHDVEDVKEGICFELVKTLSRTTHNRIWTSKHAAHVRYWVVNGASTQIRLYDMCWADSKCCKCCQKGGELHRLYHCAG